MDGDQTPDSSSEGSLFNRAGTNAPTLERTVFFVPSRYRWGVLGLIAVSVLAGAGGVVFSAAREALFSMAIAGLFGSVLLTLLGSNRLIPAVVAESVYNCAVRNQVAIVDSLSLSDQRMYVPTAAGVLLYVPRTDTQSFPADVPRVGVTDDRTMLVLEPMGTGLLNQVDNTVVADTEYELETTVTTLTEGLFDVLEVADEADATIHAADGSITVAVSSASFGDLDRFDHPIRSYLAVGLARELDQPVTTEVHWVGGKAEWHITCSWTPEKTGHASESTPSEPLS